MRMSKAGFDQQALIDQFTQAAAKGNEQLRKAVHDATLKALQGRELTLKNIRGVVGKVTEAASAGAEKTGLAGKGVGGISGGGKVQAMLDTAVAGMDDALLKAVEANRLALQRLVDQGVSLRETQLKKALGDLEKMEDTMLAAVKKAAGSAGDGLAGPWMQVLEKFNVSGTQTGVQASGAVEALVGQMHTTLRDTRAASLKAAQTLAESYTALVSGVMIGMADALRQGGAGKSSPKK
jgi:hypothetical protein